jgi:CRISPR/Cas system-associated exonuclease Cas4 (RecB family)
LGFAGNLKTVSLPDVFQLIVTSKKTGMLTISKNEARRDIYFRDGLLMYAHSNSREDLFGNLLLKKGRITKAELDDILKTENEGKKIGALLVEKNLFSKEEILECLKMQIEEIVYALFGWRDGNFEFTEGKAPPANVIQTQLNPMNVIMEGMRRIDEWVELKKVLPQDEAILEIVPDPQIKSEEMVRARTDFQVLSLISSGRPFQQIVEDSLLDQFLTCKAIVNLMNMGLVREGKSSSAGKTSEQEQKALIELLANIYINNIIFIFYNLKEKLGARGEKVIYDTFEENRMFYPVLSQIFSGRDGQVNLDLFVELYKRLPEESRIWRLVSNFNSLLNDYLIAVQKNLGNKVYRRVLSEIRINIQNVINRNRQIAMKYGLEEEFSRILREQ